MTGRPAHPARTGPPAISLQDAWQVGRNVPWTVGWSGEQSFSLGDPTDFPGLMDLRQVERPGEGTPKFAQMHVSRLRRGMVGHLCHVCGRRTLKGDRYIFPVQSGNMMPVIGAAAPRYVGNVPPVHLACAKRAQRLCPHLISEYADPVAYPSEDSEVRPRLDVVEGLEDLARKVPRGVKVVYSCIRLYGPRFSRQVEKLRAAHAGAKAE